MRAEIISVGTELLLGFIVDTNAAYLAQSLTEVGIDLYYISTFGDNRGRLAEGVRRAWGRSDLVIFTGGLGPTEDDLTRDAIAEALEEEMFIDPDLAEWQREFWQRRNMEMPPRNLTQAQLIPSARALPNPIGTAPGWWVEKHGVIAVTMPGVPREMNKMWTEQILPELRERTGAGILLTRNLKIMGKGESAVEHDVRHLLASTNPTIATYAKADGVHLRLSVKADHRDEAERLLAEFERGVRDIVAQDVWGVDDERFGDVLAHLLGPRRFAIMDDLTAGGLSLNLTEAPAMAAKLAGAEVAASPDALTMVKGAAPAGSAEAAAALARAAKERFGAEVGIGISGVAGPGPHAGIEAGTFALAIDDGTPAVQTSFRASTPPEVRRWASYNALNLIWRKLAGRPLP